MAELVLASASPRRRELLAMLGHPFDVVVADVDESVLDGESAPALAERLAQAKADAVATLVGADHIVIGADTVVTVDGTILGKPLDRAESNAMIERLAGRPHQVITGVAIARGEHRSCATSTTTVWFRPMTADEMSAYVATGEGDDKAGAYAIQGLGGRFVERIDGSYHNVVGLPLTLVETLLAELRAELGANPVGYRRSTRPV